MAYNGQSEPAGPQEKTLQELRTVKPGVLGETAWLGLWPPCNWPKTPLGVCLPR